MDDDIIKRTLIDALEKLESKVSKRNQYYREDKKLIELLKKENEELKAQLYESKAKEKSIMAIEKIDMNMDILSHHSHLVPDLVKANKESILDPDSSEDVEVSITKLKKLVTKKS